MHGRNVFRERERAMEETYFRARDTRLVGKLRARATFGELAVALEEKLEVDDPELLRDITDLGLTQETGAALLVAPLVQVAWADGVVTRRDRDVVLAFAESRGLEPGTPAHTELARWLGQRPPAVLFETALTTIRTGLSVLTPPEQDERVRRLVKACRQVAMASGGFLALLGGPGEVSRKEADVLDAITTQLHEVAMPRS